MVKKYRLLKDSPFAKEGVIFQEWTGERSGKKEKVLVSTNNLTTSLWVEDVKNFDEWFEEVKELKQIYYVDNLGGYVSKLEPINFPKLIANLKAVGSYFETREEAEKYLEYLKAKAIIKQDTKGFKPDWTNYDEQKYIGFWDLDENKLDWLLRSIFIEATIYFKSREDIEESFEKHPEEWKAYLTYEQQTNRKKD